jgi:ADP-heptose:LPS heptosyltransferase
MLLFIDLLISLIGILNFKKYKRSNKPSLFIVKMDGFGDYILFRNFMNEIKESDAWKDYNIILIGSNLWKDFSLAFDQNIFKDAFFLSLNDFYFNLFYRLKTFWNLLDFIKPYQNPQNCILIPTYSRKFFIDDSLANFIWTVHSRNKLIRRVVHESDYSNMKKWQQRWSLFSLYSESISSAPISEMIFEFYRYRIFFSKFLNRNITLKRPYIDIPQNKFISANNKIFLVPGSSVPERRWPLKSFAELVVLFAEKSDIKYDFVIIGSKSEMDLGKEIISYIQDSPYKDKISIRNACGEYSLKELVYQIAEADLVVTNETGSAHLTQAIGIPMICLAPHFNYIRYHPYPTSMSSTTCYLYPEADKDIRSIPVSLVYLTHIKLKIGT